MRPSLRGEGAWLFAAALVPSAARAGAWTLGAGRVYVKETASWWETDRKFASSLDEQLDFPGRGRVSAGDRIPFDPVTGGTLRAAALTTDVRIGVLDRLDLGASVPLLWVDFDTTPVDTVDSRFGLGDLLLSAQALALRRDRVALAARVEGKLPTGRFDPSVFAAPLTEGQTDLALIASAGVSLFPHGYANAESGWRFRFENDRNGRDPGDEILYSVEGGLELGHGLMVKVVHDGLAGRAGVQRQFGTETPLPRRRLFSLWGGLLWRATPEVTFELDARWLIAGEDFPTGVQLFGGLAAAFDLPGVHR